MTSHEKKRQAADEPPGLKGLKAECGLRKRALAFSLERLAFPP
jgi:hypothetical protein